LLLVAANSVALLQFYFSAAVVNAANYVALPLSSLLLLLLLTMLQQFYAAAVTINITVNLLYCC
jgi:hypothetical protein